MSAAIRQLILLLLATCLIAMGFPAVAQDSGPRIGYVDMKRLLDQAPQVQQAHDRLQAEFAEQDQALQKEQKRLDALRASLDHDRDDLDAARLAERQSEIDVLAGSVRRARERMQQELQSRSTQELDASWQIISNAAVEYARSEGYDLLLPSPVIYASPRVDITDAVLQKLRRESPPRSRD